MKSIRAYGIIIVSIHLLLQQTYSYAASMGVSPVKIYLTPEHSITSLEVRNNSDQPIFVQSESVVWSQVEGVSTYQPTTELVISPPIFQIPPKGFQIVRLAVNQANDRAIEKTYRLFLTEVPLTNTVDGSGVQFNLRLGLPVFLTPTQAEPSLIWKAQTKCDGKLQISANNNGTAHKLVMKLSLKNIQDNTLLSELTSPRYILRNSNGQWEFNIDEIQLPNEFRVEFQDGSGAMSTIDLNQESASC